MMLANIDAGDCVIGATTTEAQCKLHAWDWGRRRLPLVFGEEEAEERD